MNKLNIFDSHVHSNNSHDAQDSVEKLAERAKELGILGFALTDHFECDDLIQLEKHQLAIDQSVKDATDANNAAKCEIFIAKGIELGQPHYEPKIAEDMLNRNNFDFVIGSVHTIKGGKDFAYLDYSQADISVPDILEGYFKSNLELVRWGKFDALGHLGYPARYIQGKYGIYCDFDKYSDIIDEILKALIQNSIALEINTSGMRTALKAPNPYITTVKRYIELGGEIITISSDAHAAHNLANGLSEILEQLKGIGCKYFARFCERKPIMEKII